LRSSARFSRPGTTPKPLFLMAFCRVAPRAGVEPTTYRLGGAGRLFCAKSRNRRPQIPKGLACCRVLPAVPVLVGNCAKSAPSSGRQADTVARCARHGPADPARRYGASDGPKEGIRGLVVGLGLSGYQPALPPFRLVAGCCGSRSGSRSLAATPAFPGGARRPADARRVPADTPPRSQPGSPPSPPPASGSAGCAPRAPGNAQSGRRGHPCPEPAAPRGGRRGANLPASPRNRNPGAGPGSLCR
jgi:hypothetical protein